MNAPNEKEIIKILVDGWEGPVEILRQKLKPLGFYDLPLPERRRIDNLAEAQRKNKSENISK